MATVHITFAHISLLRTQWSHLIAREAGKCSLSVGLERRTEHRYHGAWALQPDSLDLNPNFAP